MRCFLRLLSRRTCGMANFDCSDCEGVAESGDSKFNPGNPAGPYKLDLGRTYCRTMLRMLYNTCERLQINPDSCFKDVRFSAQSAGGGPQVPFEHPNQRDNSGGYP